MTWESKFDRASRASNNGAMFGNRAHSGDAMRCPHRQLPKISVSGRPGNDLARNSVTKWSTHSGDSAVSEEKPETNGESGSLSGEPAVSHSSDAQSEPLPASAHASTQIEAGATAEMSQPDISKSEAGPDQPKASAANAEAPHSPGKVIVMSSAGRTWANNGAGSQPEADERQGVFGKRRFAAMAAVVALATVAGALGGALATATLIHGGDVASGNHGLEASVARIDADILALKADLENSAKLGTLSLIHI